MRIHPDFTIQQVGESFVAVPVGKTSEHFHAMISLNATGAFLWKLMAEKDCTEEDLVAALLEVYEIDTETAAKDVHRIVEALREGGVFA
ncbi:MAG: PqqD family protein [Clostridia bacterium]|nr:PqqD family protein [Clostridia bacterium]